MKVTVQVRLRGQGSGVRVSTTFWEWQLFCYPCALTNLIIDLHELSLEHQLRQLVEPYPSDQRIAGTTKGFKERGGFVVER